MRSLASYTMRGLLQAASVVVVFAALSLFLPPISYLSGAGVGLVTLRYGAKQGLIVTLIAVLVLCAISFFVFGSPALGPIFALTLWLPVWALAYVLRSSASLAFTLGIAAAIGCFTIFVIHLFTADAVAFWREGLETMLRPAIEQSGLMTDPQQINLWLSEIARLFTGVVASTLMLSLIFSLFIARWWQAMLYNAGGFRREFHTLRLSRKMALPMLLVLGFALIGSGDTALMATDLLLVGLTLYMIQGLSLAHGAAAKFDAHMAWLVALYSLMLVAPPQVGVLLAAAGFASTWLNFPSDVGVADDKKHD